MKSQLVYNVVHLKNINSDPIYIPNLGIIVDNISGKLIHKLSINNANKYYNIELKFCNYQYSKIYEPLYHLFDKSYSNHIVSKKYNIVLNLNIKNLLGQNIQSKKARIKLCDYLYIIQLRNIIKNKNYEIKINELDFHIKNHESIHGYMIPWYYIDIGKEYYFNFKNKNLCHNKSIKRIKFKRKGGIIETNNVLNVISKILSNNKYDKNKTLIIMPNNMINVYDDIKMTYYENIINLQTKSYEYDRIILHECNITFLTNIKKLLKNMNIECIWIVNTLPLKYYFNDNNISSINNIFSFLNIWLDLNTNKKKFYKIDVIKYIFMEFNNKYAIINYNLDIVKYLTFDASKTEQYIHDEYMKHYNHWLLNLTNDPNNKYSFCSKKKNNTIKSKIYNSLILLSLSNIYKNQINDFFEPKIITTINASNNAKHNIDLLINKYRSADQISFLRFGQYDIIDLQEIMSNLNENKKKIETILSNYNRYNKSKHYNETLVDCPICYGSENLVQSKLICGHTICLDCILNILPNSKKCPVCNEHINIKKIAIIHSDINTISSFSNYFTNLDKNSIILTNIMLGKKLPFCDAPILNIMQNNFNSKLAFIKSMKMINNIIIVTTPDNILSKYDKIFLDKIICHLKLFYGQINICKIQINFNNSCFEVSQKNDNQKQELIPIYS
ncbi:ring finger [Acanthamoeba polyphaga mimivirus]|uniref:Ring finger n=6 Tax=Megamimivirinae TaxID=3044648 RepID=A0A2L2DJH4_MIMIV|nr:putative ring finger protein [Megavirus chiliensis]AEQ32713.1 RING finger protein [Megavirus chiliensis]AVG46321.1 ring finger [Acanthamoeba polyphaga mimivirus]AVG47432.1 ring finger [Acanthamoeba polyphaga mimivirus]